MIDLIVSLGTGAGVGTSARVWVRSVSTKMRERSGLIDFIMSLSADTSVGAGVGK